MFTALAAELAGLQGSRRAGAEVCIRYLGNMHDCRRYDDLAAGWQIATGSSRAHAAT
jgi:hypothetical protein